MSNMDTGQTELVLLFRGNFTGIVRWLVTAQTCNYAYRVLLHPRRCFEALDRRREKGANVKTRSR